MREKISSFWQKLCNEFVSHETIKIGNLIGICGALIDMCLFIFTLFQIGSDESNWQIYINAVVMAVLFVIFFRMSVQKIKSGSHIHLFLSGSYSFLISLILIATYFVCADIITVYGYDLYNEDRTLNYSSKFGIAIFMFILSYIGTFALFSKANTRIKDIASIPIAITLIWLLIRLVSGQVTEGISEGAHSMVFISTYLMMFCIFALSGYLLIERLNDGAVITKTTEAQKKTLKT